MAVKVDVTDHVSSETGQTVTKVTISHGAQINSIVASVLIGAALFYLVGILVVICIKKQRRRIRNSQEDASSDGNF